MKKHQFNELELLNSSRFGLPIPRGAPSAPVRLIRTVGKNKGKIGTLSGTYQTRITAIFDGEEDEGHYSKYELVDDNGEMILCPVSDMTEREIFVGDYLVYSVPAGSNSSALEMGKVEQFGPVGSPMVKRIMQNGKKINNQGGSLKNITDPARCIKMPISDELLVLWLLKDFKDLNEK